MVGIVAQQGVVPLLADPGGLLALRADGTVVEIPWRSPERAVAVADVRTRDIAVIQGARLEPALLVLRPRRAEGDPDCPHCGGIGRFEPSMPSVVCFCAGLGFLPAAWDEPDEEDPAPRQEALVRRAAVVVADARTWVAEGERAPGSIASPDSSPRAPQPETRAAAVRASPETSLEPTSPAGSRRASVLLGVLLAFAGGVGAVAVGSSHDLGSVGLAIACGAGMLPGVTLLAWITSR